MAPWQPQAPAGRSASPGQSKLLWRFAASRPTPSPAAACRLKISAVCRIKIPALPRLDFWRVWRSQLARPPLPAALPTQPFRSQQEGQRQH